MTSTTLTKELPKKMKAIVQTGYGKIEEYEKLFKIAELDVPNVSENNVLIKVHSASLNPVDWKLLQESFKNIFPTNFPRIMGWDFSGKIVKLGKNVKESDFKIGDIVFGCAHYSCGTFAEYINIPTKFVYKIPLPLNVISHSEYSSFGLVAITAFGALLTLNLSKNDNIIILGGSSAVGTQAIQMAKNYFGVNYIITTSSKEEFCKKLGANYVVNYRKDSWFDVIKNGKYSVSDKNDENKENLEFNALIDCVGDKNSRDKAHQILKKDKNNNFRYITVSAFSGMKQNEFYAAKHIKEEFELIIQMIKNKQIKAFLDNESPFKFEDWSKMIGKSINGKINGKLIINFE